MGTSGGSMLSARRQPVAPIARAPEVQAPALPTSSVGPAPRAGYSGTGLQGSQPYNHQANPIGMGRVTDNSTGQQPTNSFVQSIQDRTGVAPGVAPQQNAVQQAQNQGPDLAAIQEEMKRREVGAQLNANPANSALSGYLMG